MDRSGLSVGPVLPKSLEDSLFMGAKLPPIQRVRESLVSPLLGIPVLGRAPFRPITLKANTNSSQGPIFGQSANFSKTPVIDNHEDRYLGNFAQAKTSLLSGL